MNWKAISVAVISDRSQLTRDMLTELGCERVVEADDGDGAFVLFALGFIPDVVVVDGAGARFDGLAVASRIRRTPELSRVPIVMVSATADYRRVMGAREVGVNAILLDPVAVGALGARISRLLEPEKQKPWRTTAGRTPAGRRHIGRIAAGSAWLSDTERANRRPF
jgi:two-component system chemotaxis response regulator CheY